MKPRVRQREPGSNVGPHARQALRVDEVSRARGVAVLLGGLAAVAAAWFPLLGGDAELRYIAIAAMVYITLVAGTLVWRAKPDASYPLLFRWFGISSVLVSGPLQLFLGVFSPTPIVVMIGIAFFGGADDRRWGIGISISAIAVWTVLAVLISLDIIPDKGLIQGNTMPMGKLFGCVMVPVAFGGTLRHAILSRRATHAAMAQVEEAMRVIQQREAQLAEVKRDLDAALEVGAGQRGRYSGRQAGNWLLGAVIGRGAMGEVYAATRDDTKKTAAVKTMVAASEPELVERFRREVEITSQLHAASLVAVYDHGTLDDHTPYLVMELLRGHDLAWHLRKRQLAMHEAITLCEQVASGLRAAHEAGVVHRDIKPQNLFRHEPEHGAPVWKILDFGVSKLADSSGTLTQNLVVGTPGYMAPEQARGKTADQRSDLFSLGSVLYRTITGQLPFRGNDPPQVMFDVVYRAPKRPSELAPTLAPDLDLFFAVALAKRSEQRFASADELSRAFVAAVGQRLPGAVRRRAETLLAELPWGGRLRAESLTEID